jgi:DNA-binding HxlR family transcriptional regulator
MPPSTSCSSLLEARYADAVLWALRDGHAQTFRLLQDSVGGITPNTLNTRIKELREAGLVSHGSEGYASRPPGRPAQAHERAAALRRQWVASQAKKKQSDMKPSRCRLPPMRAGHADRSRAWVQGQRRRAGAVSADACHDLSQLAPTCSDLLELPDRRNAVRCASRPRLARLAAVLANSACDARDPPCPAAPVRPAGDQGAGVTFVVACSSA